MDSLGEDACHSWEGDFTPQLTQDPMSGRFYSHLAKQTGDLPPQGITQSFGPLKSYILTIGPGPKNPSQTSQTCFGTVPSFNLDLNYLPGDGTG